MRTPQERPTEELLTEHINTEKYERMYRIEHSLPVRVIFYAAISNWKSSIGLFILLGLWWQGKRVECGAPVPTCLHPEMTGEMSVHNSLTKVSYPGREGHWHE